MLFGLQSVQVVQAHPEKELHYSEKLFLHFPWLAPAWGWGRSSFTWALRVLEVAIGIFIIWAVSVPLGPHFSLKYTFLLYLSCSPVWFFMFLLLSKAHHPHLRILACCLTLSLQLRWDGRRSLNTSPLFHCGGWCHKEELYRQNRDKFLRWPRNTPGRTSGSLGTSTMEPFCAIPSVGAASSGQVCLNLRAAPRL